MGVNDIFFKKNIKLAFSRVKEHIVNIEGQLKAVSEENRIYKDEINKLREEVAALRKDLNFPVESEKPEEPQKQPSEEVSSGNQGGYSFIHSFTKHSLGSYALAKHSLGTKNDQFQGFKQDFDKLFNSLSRQEFLTFLTIYQLEEEVTNVTYLHVAEKLKLTEGCIRTYVASLLKKGLPLVKKKYNNRQIFLTISPEFRSLNFKQKLIDNFYNLDPNQKKLQETF